MLGISRITVLGLLFAAYSLANDPADLAPLGRVHVADGTATVEWEEAREVNELRVKTRLPVKAEDVLAEYWVHTWPPKESRGGWTESDSAFQGSWKKVEASINVNGREVQVRFQPLTTTENPNANNRPGYAPRSRLALKVRVTAPGVESISIYGTARWTTRTLRIDTTCDGKGEAKDLTTSIYNGHIQSQRSESGLLELNLEALTTRPGLQSQAVLQLALRNHAFGVSLTDLARYQTIYVPSAGVSISDGSDGETCAEYLSSGRRRPGTDVSSRVGARAEQTLDRATSEIPALSKTFNNGRHPYRYVPLGLYGLREKIALEFNGNLFVSKHGTKLFADELTRLQWEGDKIRFRIGTNSDYRERENSANQHMLEDVLPIVETSWITNGIEVREEAFATSLSDAVIALVRLQLKNRTDKPKVPGLSLAIAPSEPLCRKGDLLAVCSNGNLRAVQRGDWNSSLAPGETNTLYLYVPVRTFSDHDEQVKIAALDYDSERSRIVAVWRTLTAGGMTLHVPDENINRLWRGSLLHMLISVQQDAKTGLYMLPCGTYDYNMFLNETDMQIRLLNQRGLHSLSQTFLQPMLDLQGSKPFPGLFKETAAIFHGIKVDDAHDYTNSGYNLNHGWTLWTLAEHYWYSRDHEWLKTNWGRILRGADWIVSERKATDNGLLPAGQLEDVEEFQQWFAVNGYAYKGLAAVAKLAQDVDAAQADRLSREAAAYRKDIRAAVQKAMATTPVVRLHDDTWIPSIPSHPALHGRELGWIRNILYGPHALVDCGVIDAEEGWTTWILQDLEANLFMGPESFSVSEQDWFSRGGIALQPNLVNTAMTYLVRGDAPMSLRAFFNTFAVSYYPDINAFTEWVPSFGRSGGPFYKTSDEAGFLTWLRMFLVREEGDTLQLAYGTPRRWFEDGGKVEIRDASTFLGKVSYTIESHAASGYIDTLVDGPPHATTIRIRHPQGHKIERVEYNHANWTHFNGDRELITLPDTSGPIQLRVYFHKP